MLKIILFAILAAVAWITGSIALVIGAYFLWEFVKGAMGGGGVTGGLSAVAFRAFFAALIYLAFASDKIQGSTSLMVGLAGAIGLLINSIPKNLSASMRQGIAAAQVDKEVKNLNASKASFASQTEAENKKISKEGVSVKGVYDGVKGVYDGTGNAHARLSDSTDGLHIKEDNSGGGNSSSSTKKQGTLNWFFNGSDGSAEAIKQQKKRAKGSGYIAWFFTGAPITKKIDTE